MKNYLIYKNVFLGEGSVLQSGVILGIPPFDKKEGELKTVIGKNSVIRSNTVIYAGTRIGDNFQTGHNVVIREENEIGDDFCVWSNSIIYPGNKIGNKVKIHCNCFIEDSVLENGVFLGPQVVLTDDLHPVCPKWKSCVGGPKIGKNVSIGGNSTILPGIIIGHDSLIAAGSVITKNVSPESVVVGNPGKETKKITELKCLKNYFEKPFDWRKNES